MWIFIYLFSGLMLRDPLFSNDNKMFSDLTSLVQPTLDINSNNFESEPSEFKPERCISCKDNKLNLEQNHIVRNPWRSGFEDDYDDPNIELEYGETSMEFDDFDPPKFMSKEHEHENTVTSGSAVQLTYALPPRLETGSPFDRQLVYKSPAYLPPNHGINGLDLLLSGGKPTTFQSYIRRKINMNSPVEEISEFVVPIEPVEFTGNLEEDPNQGTWAGSSDWVQHWIRK